MAFTLAKASTRAPFPPCFVQSVPPSCIPPQHNLAGRAKTGIAKPSTMCAGRQPVLRRCRRKRRRTRRQNWCIANTRDSHRESIPPRIFTRALFSPPSLFCLALVPPSCVPSHHHRHRHQCPNPPRDRPTRFGEAVYSTLRKDQGETYFLGFGALLLCALYLLDASYWTSTAAVAARRSLVLAAASSMVGHGAWPGEVIRISAVLNAVRWASSQHVTVELLRTRVPHVGGSELRASLRDPSATQNLNLGPYTSNPEP